MSDNLDKNNSFSIQDTREMGIGDTQLLNDLFTPENESGNPDDVTPIVKETDLSTSNIDKENKDVISKNVDDLTNENKESSLISDFLNNDEYEDDDFNKDKKTSKINSDSSKTEKREEDNDDDYDDDDNRFNALSNDLFKLGVFNKGEEEDENVSINTAQELLERFNTEKKKAADDIVSNFIGQFGEDYQNAFDSIFVKGANPKEYFGAYNKVVSFSEMDLSKEQNQILIMKQALTDQGFDPEDVETEIERLQNYGDLDTVSVKHHKVLVKKEAKKLDKINSEAEETQRQKAEIKKHYINNVQSILSDKLKEKEFDGIPINSNLANELQDFLLTDKWKTPAGETLTDFDRAILDLKRPENHEMKVKVGLLMKTLEKDPTLSTIQRKGVTKQSNKLFEEVTKQVSKNSRSSKNKPKSWFL
tara:strand:- start:946 stop:2202 length:1257 start_codon:yes stop_codon:yes gene_type:complete